MPDYDKTNTVTINQNDKGGVESRADLKLDLNIDGVRYFAKAWRHDGSNGAFYSGPIERAAEQYQPSGSPVAAVASNGDDSIPF